MQIVVNLRYDAQELALWKVSDHAMVELKIEPRLESPKAHQNIPAFIFGTDGYKEQLTTCLGACDLDSMSDRESWGR
eukprot:2150504-Pyramimonas_sp.AAC.1